MQHHNSTPSRHVMKTTAPYSKTLARQQQHHDRVPTRQRQCHDNAPVHCGGTPGR
jgi:hypothetical protein